MKRISAVGLMSGTSADGISAAWVEVGRKVRVRGFANYPFTKKQQARILALRDASAREVCEANMWLGDLFARAASRFLSGRRARPHVIGSHGQTIYHVPGKATLQIGEAAVIAERTGVTTVADFRPADIAAGGEGAPLVPYFDEVLFGGGPARALQNIGGIGNVTVVGRGRKTVAFDTGPGNTLIDEAARMVSRGRAAMDRGGRRAAGGKVDPRALARLMRHPYLRKKPPKSTGREAFSREFLESCCGRRLRNRPEDLLATLTFFTAESISEAYRRFLPEVSEVIVSGGGVFNRTLMRFLEGLLSPVPVRSIETCGVHPLAKEPAAFALLAARAVRGRPNHVGHRSVLGKIVPGRNYGRLTARGSRR